MIRKSESRLSEEIMIDQDSLLIHGRRPARRARLAVPNVAAWMSRAVAAMLDVDAARLRAEFASIRPANRLLMIGLLAWIVCCVAGMLIAVIYITSPREISAAQAAYAAPVETTARSSYEAIVMRPLFWRSRQPASPPPPPSPEFAASPVQIQGDRQISLRGVFISDELAKAFMLSAEYPAGAWRRRGEDFGGWRVTEISRDHVVLESRTDRFVVPLSHTNGR